MFDGCLLFKVTLSLAREKKATLYFQRCLKLIEHIVFKVHSENLGGNLNVIGKYFLFILRRGIFLERKFHVSK